MPQQRQLHDATFDADYVDKTEREPAEDEDRLRTPLREIISDVLQKGYEKGWDKGRTQGFVAGYHKGWSGAHFWYQVARRDGGHQMLGGIDDTLQQPEFFPAKYSV